MASPHPDGRAGIDAALVKRLIDAQFPHWSGLPVTPVERCLAALEGHVDTDRARAVWDAALAAEWHGEPVWFHGDIASGNLLVEDGELSAVIDFGTSGVGDPACDLVIAWGMFRSESREAFRAAVGQDAGTWARARGWALWKALLNLTGYVGTDRERADNELRVVEAVLADHDRFG
ncbi:phosphotransferase [Streptomyces sp. NPDC050255]|uniref:phosphotransferase n=1 Tax=Streptomyces sp. NPDC050255 TaxID=3365606 RepID=UPI0037B4542F